MGDKYCNDCTDALYIGDGDTLCDKAGNKLVLVDWTPTEHYGWCNHAERKKQRGKIQKRGSGKKATRSTKSN